MIKFRDNNFKLSVFRQEFPSFISVTTRHKVPNSIKAKPMMKHPVR